LRVARIGVAGSDGIEVGGLAMSEAIAAVMLQPFTFIDVRLGVTIEEREKRKDARRRPHSMAPRHPSSLPTQRALVVFFRREPLDEVG